MGRITGLIHSPAMATSCGGSVGSGGGGGGGSGGSGSGRGMAVIQSPT